MLFIEGKSHFGILSVCFFFFVSHCVINYSALLIHSFTLEICFLWVFVCVFVCFSQPHSSEDYFLGLEIEAEAKLP